MRHSLWMAALAAAGCTVEISGDLATEDMSAELAVFAYGDGNSVAEAILRRGSLTSATFVDLTGADVLTVQLGDEVVEMQAEDLAALRRYRASFTSDAPDLLYRFDLSREVDAGAPSSTVDLPEPFSLDPIPPTLAPTDTLTVTWSPAQTADAMSVRIEGSCIQTFEDDVDGDPGSWTLDAVDLEPHDPKNATACGLEVRVVRARTGLVDPGFGTGIITGQQQRTANIRYEP